METEACMVMVVVGYQGQGAQMRGPRRATCCPCPGPPSPSLCLRGCPCLGWALPGCPRTPEGSSCSGGRSGQQLSQDSRSAGPWMR